MRFVFCRRRNYLYSPPFLAPDALPFVFQIIPVIHGYNTEFNAACCYFLDKYSTSVFNCAQCTSFGQMAKNDVH